MLIFMLANVTEKDRVSSITYAQAVMIIKIQKNNNNEPDSYHGHEDPLKAHILCQFFLLYLCSAFSVLYYTQGSAQHTTEASNNGLVVRNYL